MELLAIASSQGDTIGGDLRAAADDAEQRLNASVERRQRQELDDARASLEDGP
jgi:hypothetical protein